MVAWLSEIGVAIRKRLEWVKAWIVSNRLKRVYTYEKDPVDPRDYLQPVSTGPVPVSVDLRSMMSPVEDQGNLGSCTGNAIAGALEFLENKTLPKSQFVDISRLFIYYNERVIEGTVKEDSGAFIRDGVKAAATVGACSETVWPYIIRKFMTKPPVRAFADAAKRKISQYLRITNLAGIKQSLAAGYPVVFGFQVYQQFESDQCAHDGIVVMPIPGEQSIGGHAVLAVGYDDTKQMLLVRNSWGASWGIGGYFWLPYGYVTKGLADDFWSIRK